MKKRKLLSYLAIFALALIYMNNNSSLPTAKDSLHLYEHTEEGQSVANDSIEKKYADSLLRSSTTRLDYFILFKIFLNML